MSAGQWTAVDAYFNTLFLDADPVLDAALQEVAAEGLPTVSVAPAFGKLLNLLARLGRARTILEIGTLGGYSTIWLARALPAGGKMVTLEINPTHAEVARGNIVRARLDRAVELRVGDALDILPDLWAEKHEPFDMIFIDADKERLSEYFTWAHRLSRAGSCIIVDNVVREGAVIDASSKDKRVQGIRRFNEAVAAEPRVTATAIQAVGAKGYDGFAVIMVIEAPVESPRSS